MKKLSICTTIFFALLICFYSNNLQAQFFKKIMNTVKNTAQNRANNQASQSTNNTIDKAVSGKTSNTNNSSMQGGDSASTNRVLGAFAKAAQDNPNDTSMSDLLGKSLGNLTGGGGVSAADSVAAIKSYMSADGGSGTYYEYSIETNTKKTGTTKSTSKLYFTSNGEGRSEMNIAAMMGAKNSSALIVIGKTNQPHYSIILDEEEKSYSLNVIDTSLINSNFEKYKVTKIGNENVQGYNCIHARVVSTTGSGMFKSSSTMDVWTSVDVPGYAVFKKATIQQNVQPAMTKALDDAGCAGFFVKMTNADAKDYSMTMQLTKAEKQTFPASMFKIPSGYTESKSNLMFGNMMQAVPKK
ncbi:MAG TPA: DUF4412 domain-containing protein [Hanamia sp.]